MTKKLRLGVRRNSVVFGVLAATVLIFGGWRIAEAGGTVSGTVVNPSGGTLSEQVNVCLFGPSGGNCVMTAANGTYSMSLSPGKYEGQAKPQSSSVYAPSLRPQFDVYDGQTTTANFMLSALQLSGRLTKQDGTGIGASVDVHNETFTQFAHTESDGSGYYKVGGLPAGTYIVEPRAPYGNSALAAPDPVSVALTTSGVVEKNFTYAPAAKKILGKVLKSNGTPVPNANVNAFRQNGGGFVNAMTNATGDFELGVSGGTWNVQPSGGNDADWIYQNQPSLIEFSIGTTIEEKTVNFTVLAATATITGTVKDRNGASITNGHLDIRSQNGFGNGMPLNSSGTFTIKTVGGTYNVHLWTPDGLYALPATTVTIQDNQTVTLNLVAATKDARISGSVRRPDGSPAPNVEVNAFQITGLGGGPGGFSNSRSDQSGNYTLAVTDGTWNVHIGMGPNNDFVWANPRPLEIRVPTSTSSISAIEYPDLNLTVVLADAKIIGRVIDSSTGQPVTNFFGCAFARAAGTFTESCSPIQNGTFTIKISSSTGTSWDVGTHVPPNSEYSGSAPQRVTVVANGTAQVNIELIKNNSRLRGKISDSTGFPLSSCAGFDGRVFADGINGHYESRINDDCSYGIGLVAGTYMVGTFFSPSSGIIGRPPSPEDQVLVLSGQEVEKNITIVKGDATISGLFVGPDGNPVSRGFVHADNIGQINEAREKIAGPPGQGPKGDDLGFNKRMPCGAKDIPGVIKCCNVAKNKKECESFAVPDGPNGCKNAYSCVRECKKDPKQCEDKSREGEPSGPQPGQDFTGPGGCKSREECDAYCSKPENFKTCSEFRPPSGAQSVRVLSRPLSILAEGPGAPPSGKSGPGGFDNAIRAGGPVSPDGTFALTVLSGHKYRVCGGLPPESASMPPKCVEVDLTTSRSANITLQGRNADAQIEVTVKISGQTPERCHVHGFSEDGGFTGSPCQPGANGLVTLNVTFGTWHIQADSFDGETFYSSEDRTIVVKEKKTQKVELPLKKGRFRVPEPVTTNFQCANPTTVTLDNGTQLDIPAGSISSDDDGQCSITATPSISTGSTSGSQRVGLAYDIVARNENGQEVADLKQNVTIKLALEKDALEDEGIESDSILPAFYNEDTGSYENITNSTVSTTERNNTDYVEVKFTTDHFSSYTAVNSSGKTKSLKKVTTATSKGKTTFTVGGKKVTPFSCAGNVTIQTGLVKSAQFVVAAADCDQTIKLYTAKGKLSKKINAFPVAAMDLADVTGDGVADLAVGSASGTPRVSVFDLSGKKPKTYKVDLTVAAASANRKVVVSAVDLGRATDSLAVAVFDQKNAVVGSPSAFDFSNKKFRSSTSSMKTYLKAASGSVTVSVGKPKVTKVAPKTISTSSTAAKLTITGQNFTTDTTVLVCGVGASVSFKSTKQLVATVNGTQLDPGKCGLTVSNGDGQRTTTAKNITVQ